MAYDLIRRTKTERDWSMGAGGTARRSLAYHAEMHNREKVVALAKLVDTEIRNNASFADVRSRGKTLPKDDETRFKNFLLAWRSWQARNVEEGKTVSNDTIANLERWRAENAEWTKRLTAAIPLPPTSTVTSLTRPTEAPVVVTGSKAPLVLGGLALLLLGLGLARGGR